MLQGSPAFSRPLASLYGDPSIGPTGNTPVPQATR